MPWRNQLLGISAKTLWVNVSQMRASLEYTITGPQHRLQCLLRVDHMRVFPAPLRKDSYLFRNFLIRYRDSSTRDAVATTESRHDISFEYFSNQPRNRQESTLQPRKNSSCSTYIAPMGAFSIPIRLGEPVCIRTAGILFDISILESSPFSSIRAKSAKDERRYISMVQDLKDSTSSECSRKMRVVDLADLPIGRDVTRRLRQSVHRHTPCTHSLQSTPVVFIPQHY